MKKFSLLIAVACLSVSAAVAQSGVTFAAHQMPSHDGAAIGERMTVTAGDHQTGNSPALSPDKVSIGPNIVCVDHLRNGVTLSHECSHNLKTTWGIDFIASDLSGTPLGAPFNWINLSTSSSAPAAGDCVTVPCTLAGLISTNGLSPASATYAHTAGTSTYSLAYTWTATGTEANVQKAAISAGGGLVGCSSNTCGFVFENTFTPVSLNTNDQLTITWTITIS